MVTHGSGAGSEKDPSAAVRGLVALGILGGEEDHARQKWYFGTEARLISASYSPKKGELVRDNINGMDVSNSLPTNQKKAIYKDRYIVDESVPENPNEPAIYPRKAYPFSSLGLNFGIFYRL